MRAVRVSLAVLALALWVSAPAAAQSGFLEIRVLDPDHAAVVGAPVVLIHLSSGDQRTDVTGASGTSQFEGLVPGEYRVEISAAGFTLHTQSLTLAGSRRTIEACWTSRPSARTSPLKLLQRCRPLAASRCRSAISRSPSTRSLRSSLKRM